MKMTSANTRKPQGQAESASKPQPPSQHVVKGQKHSNTKKQPTTIQYDDKKARARDTKRKIVKQAMLPTEKQVPLFSHLPQYEKHGSLSLKVGFQNTDIPPIVLQLGLKFANGTIMGTNARTTAILAVFKQVVEDYVTPPNKHISRDLDSKLKPMIQFLIDCRPFSLGMGNVVKYMKYHVSLTVDMSEGEAKDYIIDKLDSYLQERIVMASEMLSHYAITKIREGDVVLVFGNSSSVKRVLTLAHHKGISFRVIVVDSNPMREGKMLLRYLVNQRIQCTYILVNGIAYVMDGVTKVFLGAAAMLANGTVMARVGSSLIAMMAKARHTPVIVCAETYKFCEKVQLDSICYNELRDPDELKQTSNILEDWRKSPNLRLLNMAYDIIPMEFVTIVVTEVGMIPPTSVPVVLREYNPAGSIESGS